MKKNRRWLYLLFAAGLIALGAGGGTFATFNAQVTNKTNTFSTGSLTLKESTACKSTSTAGNSATCAGILDVNTTPYAESTSVVFKTVTLTNSGTLTASKLYLAGAAQTGVSECVTTGTTGLSVGTVNTTGKFLTPPSGLTATVVGTAGTTTYTYEVTAFTAHGQTLPSTKVTITTGPATLTATNHIHLTWTAVTGAAGYDIYGRTAGSLKKIATVTAPTTSYTDTSNTAGTGTPPTSNSSGAYHTMCSKLVLFVEETAQTSPSHTYTDCWWGNSSGSGATCAATGKLKTGLTAGATVTTLKVGKLIGAVAATDILVVTTGSHTQRFKAAAAATPGTTVTITVTSVKADAAFAATSYVVDVTPLSTTKTVSAFDTAYPGSGTTAAKWRSLLPLSASGATSSAGPALKGASTRTFRVGLFLPTLTNDYQALSAKFAIKWRILQ